MLINSLNHFRAISILIIIAGHSYDAVGMEFESLFDLSLRNLISGGTSLFVFISGFLFHHVFYPKYEYKKFLWKKCNSVFLPYFILGLTPVLLYVSTKHEGAGGYFLPDGVGIINEYLVPTIKYYVSGSFLTAYWYIPFIMVTFIASPLHIKYIKLSLLSQLSLIAIFSIVSILIHRPFANINVAQSVLYFTPVYLIGITTSLYKEKVYEYLKGKELHLLFIAISFSIIQSYLDISGYRKPPFEYAGIDIMYFQKIALCFFFIVWLHRFETYNNKNIHYIASTSFTAFFIHPFVLWFLAHLNLDIMKVDSWFFLAIFVMVLSLFCVLVAKFTKKILPKYSRYIIGY